MTGPDALPSGVVTFVFTDIEGSTGLLARLGDDYKVLLDRHRDLIRAALARHGGAEVKTIGDGCVLAFAGAPAAVAFCLDAQRSLRAEPWPSDAQFKVRMGVHVGEAILDRDDYVSLAANYAGRLCNAAHGGQVLVTGDVVQQAVDGYAAHDLGRYLLRGASQPLRLFQLQAEGGPAESFAPLRAPHATPVTDRLEREAEPAPAAASWRPRWRPAASGNCSGMPVVRLNAGAGYSSTSRTAARTASGPQSLWITASGGPSK